MPPVTTRIERECSAQAKIICQLTYQLRHSIRFEWPMLPFLQDHWRPAARQSLKNGLGVGIELHRPGLRRFVERVPHHSDPGLT
jgi:hypothetical protein